MFEFKTEDLEKARKIVSVLDLPKQFGCDDGGFDTYFIESQIEDVVDGDFFVTNGITKLVIEVEALPFVIKIPFNGQCEYMWIDENHCDDGTWHSFYHAGGASKWEYCEAEFEYTAAIQNEGYGMFVPDMMYLCNVSGYSVYVQEKVLPRCENRHVYGATDASMEKAKDCENYFDLEWSARAIDIYGVDTFVEFCEWADNKFPLMMEDMHTGNYGYRYNGDPVLLDLSGFSDQGEE